MIKTIISNKYVPQAVKWHHEDNNIEYELQRSIQQLNVAASGIPTRHISVCYKILLEKACKNLDVKHATELFKKLNANLTAKEKEDYSALLADTAKQRNIAQYNQDKLNSINFYTRCGLATFGVSTACTIFSMVGKKWTESHINSPDKRRFAKKWYNFSRYAFWASASCLIASIPTVFICWYWKEHNQYILNKSLALQKLLCTHNLDQAMST